MLTILKKIHNFLQSENKLRNLYNRFLLPSKLKKLENQVKQAKLIYGVKYKIIVSLTSYPKRFDTLPLMLKSILLQSVRPDKIVVYFDCEKSMLTSELIELQKFGITYVFGVENLKPHTKYIFAMKDYPDDIVITVDDDIIYPPNMIQTLIDIWKKYPDCICARRVHRMKFNGNGTLKPYNDWEYECKNIKTPSYDLLATGVGGVLYPPHIFDSEVFDIENIKKYCLEADDIWLKWHELRLNVKVVWAESMVVHPPVINGSQINALNAENVVNRKNDVFIENVQKNVFLCNMETISSKA